MLVVASVVALAPAAGGATHADATSESFVVQENGATFENGTVVEQRGDVATFTVQFGDADRATVTIGSPDVNYQVSFAVVDGDGDGEATVRVNTLVAGMDAGTNQSGIEAVGEDSIENYEMATEPIPGPLDAATYDMELSVDGELAAVGAIVLNERSTEGMAIWTAPAETSANDTDALLDSIAQDDTVAQGDWAVLEVQASGLYGYVESVEDLQGSEYGLNVSLTEIPGRNQPERQVDFEPAGVLADGTNDSLFVLIDTENLTVGSEYNATFAINDSNPYLDAGENESASATFSVVERNISFDDRNAAGELELPADSDVTVGGNTSVAPGTEIDVQFRTFGAGAFLESGQATVSEDGTWSVTFDLSQASNGTEFVIETDDPSANVSGVIVEGAATETPSEATDTPSDETETPEGEGTPAEETEDGEAATETTDAEETETTETDGTTEEVVETTTVADEETESSAVLTAGLPGSAVGLVGALVVASLVVLRRR